MRAGMNHPAAPLPLDAEDRSTLEMWARSATAPHRVVSQAKALLMAGDGVANSRVATALGISRPTVLDWRARFRTEGLDSVRAVRPGRGRKPEITADQVQAIVHSTLHETPPGATHWRCRSMAKAAGVSRSTVQRIWDAHGLQPHRVTTFKLSKAPAFVAASTGQPATGLIRVPQSDHHLDPRSPSAEECPDRAQERHDAVRWCRLGSTDFCGRARNRSSACDGRQQ